MELTDNIYFRNINNNAGIFDAMIAAAEDQECKEAILAFYFLLTGSAAEPTALKTKIEGFLAQAFGIDIAFKVDEALKRLAQLGLAQWDGARWQALGLEQAVGALERTWGGLIKVT
jgi:hypothetical protein